jgi:V8-like Glu-specific endopeptidase
MEQGEAPNNPLRLQCMEAQMNKKLSFAAVVIVLLLAVVPMALAITFGQPDGEGHPNVGAMIVHEPDDVYYLYCSGTLISPTVFLTAAHCTAAAAYYQPDAHEAYVTFDAVWDENATLHRGTYYVNPNYGHDSHDLNDVAVIVLDEPITDITPATLPTANLLDEMKDDQALKDQKFVTVGYGTLRDDKTKGQHSLDGYGERYVAEQYFQALKPYWLQISMNPSTGSGGTCYGDSGGPHFLGDSDMVVSVTVTGDAWCRATDVTYRLDTDSARDFLSQFVALP